MKNIIAANWKMHKTIAEARTTAEALAAGPRHPNAEVVVFPAFLGLPAVASVFADHPGMSVGGQDVYHEDHGAFTGEISPAMLADAGASWVMTGHSERRHVLGESDALVGRKTAFALGQGLKVMLCIGETLPEREAGQLEEVLARQMKAALTSVPRDASIGHIAVAYEPVWAIGTGKVAGVAEIHEAHSLVRRLLGDLMGGVAHSIHILYGGSVKPGNAADILAVEDVNGLLVGGASLEADSFLKIIAAGA